MKHFTLLLPHQCDELKLNKWYGVLKVFKRLCELGEYQGTPEDLFTFRGALSEYIEQKPDIGWEWRTKREGGKDWLGRFSVERKPKDIVHLEDYAEVQEREKKKKEVIKGKQLTIL